MNKNILIVVVAALIAVLAFIMLPSPEENMVTESTTTALTTNEAATGDTTADAKVVAEEALTENITPSPDSPAISGDIDLDQIMAIRSVGQEDAPIVIEEFASLTCSHCADFYVNTYPELKEAYIDTGKVRFVYHDFPLNAPALEATVIARCLPEGRYFQFVKFLFETQDDWAFDRNYSSYLKQNAKLLGLGEDAYNTCVTSKDVREAITGQMQSQSLKYNIRSTPTFIINGENQIVGARPFEAFKQALDPFLNQEANGTNTEGSEAE